MQLPAAELRTRISPALTGAADPSPAVPGAVRLPLEDEHPAYWIELRYQQYLAIRDLQELFESGALDDLRV